jgi:hypothetical protein
MRRNARCQTLSTLVAKSAPPTRNLIHLLFRGTDPLAQDAYYGMYMCPAGNNCNVSALIARKVDKVNGYGDVVATKVEKVVGCWCLIQAGHGEATL